MIKNLQNFQLKLFLKITKRAVLIFNCKITIFCVTHFVLVQNNHSVMFSVFLYMLGNFSNEFLNYYRRFEKLLRYSTDQIRCV